MQTTRNQSFATLSNVSIRILAIAAGAAVANSYYNQAMLGDLSRDFALSRGEVVAVPVLTQAGNAVGVMFLAPLGDRWERKSLILATIVALVAALIVAALSPGFVWLAVASLAVGLFATVAQQIVPLALHLALPAQRGHVLGRVTGGILIGILLARTISGVISERWGWPAVFAFAAVLMTIVGVALAVRLPRVPPATDLSYPRLLASLWTLIRLHRILRYAITIQFLIFAAFMAFWSNLALLLLEPAYQFGATTVGLLGLIGVAGALAAAIGGRLSDQFSPVAIVSLGAGLVVIAFTLFGLWQNSLVTLVIGMLILDVGVQASQIANQARVYALDPNARSRLNTVFMATMLLGGALGAGVGGAAYAMWGWTGICAFGATSAGLALLLSRRF